ncbi:hypothetical protein TrVE_jg3472 [Triparma verrucosa]|uniref:Uncharacterized protein n=1 Tax=Triparma verrucosa TaxID=1606542 RepID=A0A9W7B9S2_9STRA|nr:hypothetical protein TrVE_jg3472 [Triparma verrucosa]
MASSSNATRIESSIKRLTELRTSYDNHSSSAGQRTRNSSRNKGIDASTFGMQVRRSYEELSRTLKERIQITDLKRAMGLADRKLQHQFVKLFVEAIEKTFEVSFLIMTQEEERNTESTRAVRIASKAEVLSGESLDSDLETEPSIAPAYLAHIMICRAMDCIDFMKKREISRNAPLLVEALSHASFLGPVISLVLDGRFHTALRQRAGDILTLGKTNETVFNLSKSAEILDSVKRLAQHTLTVADYPLVEQVIYFLHILYKRLNSKKFPSEAKEILKTIEGVSLAFSENFPRLSNPDFPFYDKVREAIYEDQEVLADQFYESEKNKNDVSRSRAWYGEGLPRSFMFRCLGVASVYDNSTRSIGVVPWIDVNSTSLSWWCHDLGEADAAKETSHSSEDDDEDAEPKRSQVTSSSSSANGPDPVLVQIPFSGITNISFSRSLLNCIITVKRSAFMESDLSKLVRFGKEHEFVYCIEVEKEDWADFKHAILQATRRYRSPANFKSHSPQKSTKSPSKRSPATTSNTREYSTRDLHTKELGLDATRLSFVTPSKKRKSTDDSATKRTGEGNNSAVAQSVASTVHPRRKLPSFLGRVYGGGGNEPQKKRQRLNSSSRNAPATTSRDERVELSEALLATLPNEHLNDSIEESKVPPKSALPTPSTAPDVEPGIPNINTTARGSSSNPNIGLPKMLVLKQTFKDTAIPRFFESSKDLLGDTDKVNSAMATFENSLEDARMAAISLTKAAEGFLAAAREIGGETQIKVAIEVTCEGLVEAGEQIVNLASAFSEQKEGVEKQAISTLLQFQQPRNGD